MCERLLIKRIFDVIISALGIIGLSPVLFLIAILICIKLGRPIIFLQIRPGLLGKPFEIYKFRTMTSECDSTGELLPDTDRMTSLGTFLRNSSLDELPELFNVIKGEMSLVGPRPLLNEYLDKYTQEQARRHEVRPGITGWAQVNGRNAISWEEKFALDVWYVDNHTFWLDVKIILMTVWKTIKRENISQEGEATMSKFEGTKKDV